MDVRLLSNKFSVRELNENDIPLIFLLCKENKTYYYFCPPMVDEEKIREDLYVLPPNKTLDDKHFIGYFDEDKLIAIMDLIKKYPNESTCFIGIFMLDISVQNKGIGSTISKS